MEELFEIIRLSLSTLKANKLRSSLTILGIVIGVTSVILLISIGTGLKTYVTSQLEDLGADTLFVIPGEFEIAPGGGGGGGIPGAGVGASKFTFDHVRELERKAENVRFAMPYIENNAAMSFKGNTHTTQVVGVGANYQEVRDQKIETGSFFTVSQYNSSQKVVILGQTLKTKLFGEENPVGKKITISDGKFRVLGTLEKKGAFGGIDMDDQAFIPATTSIRQFGAEKIQSIWVKAKRADLVPQTKKEVEQILLRTLKDNEFSILDTQSVLGVVSNVLGVLTAALGGIAAISLVVGGIGIMNIMLVSVTERTREIGLRKAVGATPRVILTQFLIESVVLSFLGGAIGITLGILGSLAIGRFFTTSVTPQAVILAFGVSALVGVVFGVAPAARAARLNPIEALRYE